MLFASIFKYVRMGASPNFGNMFSVISVTSVTSVISASALLPFVPTQPMYILVSNLPYDFSQLPIRTDRADDEQFAKPRPWSTSGLRRYIPALGFVPLPAWCWPLLVGTVVSDPLETQRVRLWLRRRGPSGAPPFRAASAPSMASSSSPLPVTTWETSSRGASAATTGSTALTANVPADASAP